MGASTLDEQAPCTEDLPEGARLWLEEQQRREGAASARMRSRRRALRVRTVLEATALFTIFETLVTYFDAERAIVAVVCGVALGFVWDLLAVGRFRAMITGGAAHVAFRCHYGFGDPFIGFFGILAFLCIAAALGTAREMRIRDF
ncbi:MAG: hypothetical protein KDC95_08110 [Planctomycetes bacterium]|nr:hypothetical protein [Planctomycetota bacterium]